MAACKSLFSGVVCCSPGVMCAVAWCGVVLVTADAESTGCVRDGKTTGTPGERFRWHSLARHCRLGKSCLLSDGLWCFEKKLKLSGCEHYDPALTHTVEPAEKATSDDRPPGLTGHISSDGWICYIIALWWQATWLDRPPFNIKILKNCHKPFFHVTVILGPNCFRFTVVMGFIIFHSTLLMWLNLHVFSHCTRNHLFAYVSFKNCSRELCLD